ncbi:MAG: hypothetical protein GEV10_30290 [Streptosporangiales bacterium]|nr:hypothetical protein [Streptosporangiales bacterium]
MASKVKPPRVARHRPSVWTPDQLATFLRRIRHYRFYPLYLLAVTTGMRRAGLCGLRWSVVYLRTRQLAIEDTRVVVDGHAEDGDGKTDNASRMLALDGTTVAGLEGWRAVQDEERPFFLPQHRASDVGKCSAPSVTNA